MSPLLIGSCSWKFPSWEGLVYSAAKDINYLKEYALRYKTVEVDQWFWSLFEGNDVKLPRDEDLRSYSESVPKDFRFSVKVPNSLTLTHYYRKRKSDPLSANPYFLSLELWQAFRSRLEPMADRLGPLIFQFEYLNKDKMKSQRYFLELLGAFFKRILSDDIIVVEVRNPNYLNLDYFSFLENHRVCPVLLQGYWMPPVIEVYKKWRQKILSHGTLMIRLHGPDRKNIEARTGRRWDKIIEAKDDELHAIVGIVKEMLKSGVNVYLNVNNHYEGSAPLTIERIQKLIG